ncbi:MAG: monovalent cation/H+ antiporter subunit D family protein, partial [Pseudomonadota bacterium]
MSGEMAIAAALILPLIITLGIWLVGKVPNLREAVTLIGASVLFSVVIIIAGMVAGGTAPELTLWSAAPGLEFAFKAEPLGALFALIASGLWIVNSFYSIGYMRGNRERNQTRFYMCFAIAI